jgi:hypothetical protein
MYIYIISYIYTYNITYIYNTAMYHIHINDIVLGKLPRPNPATEPWNVG